MSAAVVASSADVFGQTFGHLSVSDHEPVRHVIAMGNDHRTDLRIGHGVDRARFALMFVLEALEGLDLDFNNVRQSQVGARCEGSISVSLPADSL